jgi:hypothetical protein
MHIWNVYIIVPKGVLSLSMRDFAVLYSSYLILAVIISITITVNGSIKLQLSSSYVCPSFWIGTHWSPGGRYRQDRKYKCFIPEQFR